MTPARHDRFYVGPDKTFVGDPYDWTAVGRRTDEERWATMVSPSYFLSADHYHPITGAQLRFFHGNDPNGTYEDRTVVSGARVGNTDLWVGKLNAPLSDNISFMPVLRLANDLDYVGQVIYVMGRSTDTLPSEINMRLGRNVITGMNYSSGSHFVWSYDTPGLGADEAMTQTGDSGSGSFIAFADRPTLIGIHHYVNGDTFVPHYIDAINALMAGESLTVFTETNIPEPTTFWLAVLAAAAFLVRRKAASHG